VLLSSMILLEEMLDHPAVCLIDPYI
jgi:hypothetical protein